jgi:hypothetical protein
MAGVVTVLLLATLLLVVDSVDGQVLCFRSIVEKVRLGECGVLMLVKC